MRQGRGERRAGRAAIGGSGRRLNPFYGAVVAAAPQSGGGPGAAPGAAYRGQPPRAAGSTASTASVRSRGSQASGTALSHRAGGQAVLAVHLP